MEHRLCTKDGCSRPHKARGLCLRHYAQARYHDELQPLRAVGAASCRQVGCYSDPMAQGYCRRHLFLAIERGEVAGLDQREASALLESLREDKPPRRPRAECLKRDCHDPHYSRGLCSRHYRRALRAEKAKARRAQERQVIKEWRDGSAA